MFATEPPTAAAGGLLDHAGAAGQLVRRRPRADGDLDIDSGEVGVGEAGSEVAEKDAAAVVGILVEVAPLDAGARPLTVVERPPPLPDGALDIEAVEWVEVGRRVELSTRRGRELDRDGLDSGVNAVAATAERVVGAELDAIDRVGIAQAQPCEVELARDRNHHALRTEGAVRDGALG